MNRIDLPRDIRKNQKLKEQYASEARYSMHYYVGFESLPGIKPGFSRMDTDNKERVLELCAWVFDRRAKVWLKKP